MTQLPHAAANWPRKPGRHRVNLSFFANDEAALVARCHRLTGEMNEWLSGLRGRDPLFDGTIRAAVNFWQTEPSSPYHDLESSSRHPYDVYARMVVETVGGRRIDSLDGRDLRPREPISTPTSMVVVQLKTSIGRSRLSIWISRNRSSNFSVVACTRVLSRFESWAVCS
jgi:hypothetical protein